jgi:stearoyl-CoA 9-desaturase NADPH oxidoreductase
MMLATQVLRSKAVDLLAGPHGVDRYLELIKPSLTVNDPRAEVIAVRNQTPRSATLTARPNRAFAGFRAGQFVKVGVDIDGVRRTRTYSPASSQHAADTFELTVTRHPRGRVSNHLCDQTKPGDILHLGQAQGDFTLPTPRPDRLVMISGGSGITPLMAMLRTLTDDGYVGEIRFLHYARTRADWLYKDEVERLLGRRAAYFATREGDGHLDARTLAADDGATAAVCGPPALLEAVRAAWDGPLLAETFTPPAVSLAASEANATSGAASGRLRFIKTGTSAPIGQGTLLEQAEAAGLQPEFGCRMGICHTCTCRKVAGAVRNVRTGEVSGEEDEDIQLCISVPEGDIALEL